MRKVRQRNYKLGVRFVRRDTWLGVYVDREGQALPSMLTTVQRVYVCLIPMVPIVFTIVRRYH